MNIISNSEQRVQESAEAAKVPARRLRPGDLIKPENLKTIHSEWVRIPDQGRLVHLQFRRFAGCPVCNLHLQSVVQRYSEIEAASIREIVIFHSTEEVLRHHACRLPFAVIADPEKKLYREFRVESSTRALLDPRAWAPMVRGISRSLRGIFRGQEAVPSLNLQGGRFGLPADFLIAADGRVVACKYGWHVYDQWSVEEILSRAAASAVSSE